MYRFPGTRNARRKLVTLWNLCYYELRKFKFVCLFFFFLSVSTSLWMRIFLWDAKLSVLAPCLQIPSHLPQSRKAMGQKEPGV